MMGNLLAAAERAAVQASAHRETPAAPEMHFHAAPVTVFPPEVHVTAPETTVNVEAVMPAPNVQIRNEITTPEPVVHLTTSVQPATVEVTAVLPARTTDTVIERDARGHIVRSSSTERDT